MSMTLTELKGHVSRVFGESPDPRLNAVKCINEAGRFLYNMHSWGWRTRREYPLDYIAPIAFTTATWTESTLTLTKTAGFTSYTFRHNDLVTISSGTGANTGDYRIASRTSNNAIVLAQSIGAAADGLTNMAGQIDFPYMVLPSDFGFGEIIDLTPATSINYVAVATTLAQVREMRRNTVSSSNQTVWYAIVYPSQSAVTGAAPDALIEIYPTPTALGVSQLYLGYRSGWVELTADQHTANIPTTFDNYLADLVYAMAHKYASNDMDKLYTVASDNNPALLALKKADGRAQWNKGKMGGGILQGEGRAGYQWNFTDGGIA